MSEREEESEKVDQDLAHQESRWPHRFAVLLCCATFPLIWVGGLVTTYDAGMSVPDWPTTYGYNLFLYPWKTWVFGPWDMFIEHGHRLLGAAVGMLTIAFMASVLWWDSRRWMRWLAVTALGLVVAQGLLGGVRVLADDRVLAMIHGCLGPAFFAYTGALAALTSRLWRSSGRAEPHRQGSKLHRLAGLTLIFAFLQLVLGAQLRHLPVMFSPGTFQAIVIFHLFTALVLVGHVAALAGHILRHHRRSPLLRPAALLVLLMLGQLVLGPATWIVKYGWPAWFSELSFAAGHTIQAGSLSQAMIVTGHVAVGSLIIASSTLVLLRAVRLLRPEVGVIGSGAVLMGMAT